MKNNRSSKNWLIDATLFGSFIALFFLELTGVVLHQWLGIAAGALAGYHLIAHWDWVQAVVERLLGRTTWRARLYLLVDVLMFAGMATIVLSGVLMSTWLNLPWGEAYPALSMFHTLMSQATLLLIVFKIAIHWQWIANTARRLVSRPRATAAAQGNSAARVLGRRDFVRLMGVTGLAAGVALLRTARPVAEAVGQLVAAPQVDAETLPVAEQADEQSAVVVQGVEAQSTVAAPAIRPEATPTVEATAVQRMSTATPTVAQSTPTAQAATPAATPTSQAAQKPTLCTKLCPRGFSCDYPGRCRSYRDRNGNRHCDLAEC